MPTVAHLSGPTTSHRTLLYAPFPTLHYRYLPALSPFTGPSPAAATPMAGVPPIPSRSCPTSRGCTARIHDPPYLLLLCVPCAPPSYTFDGRVYAALATQAAYATSLLTTTTGAAGVADLPVTAQDSLQSLGLDTNAWRPLSPEQQEAIAKQLRAWAGLEGPEEQSRARESLEARTLQIVASGSLLSNGTSTPPSGIVDAHSRHGDSLNHHDGRNGAAKPNEVSPVQVCFPPDFASHYRAQLQALTEGYYRQIHQEALQKDHFAGDAGAEGFGSFNNEVASRSGSLHQSQANGAVSLSSPSTEDEVTNDSGSRAIEPVTNGTGPARSRHVPHRSSPAFHATGRFRSSMPGASMHPLQEDPNGDQHGTADPAVIARAQSLGMPPSSVAAVVDNAAPPKSPVPQEGAQDPMDLLQSASVKAGAEQGSELSLEQLLSSAHQFYQFGSKTIQVAREDGKIETKTELHPLLLPLLHTLHKKNPRHLPTLLLLSCAYYSAGDLSASLYWNDQILTLDSRYVEAMR